MNRVGGVMVKIQLSVLV